MAYMCSPNQSS